MGIIPSFKLYVNKYDRVMTAVQIVLKLTPWTKIHGVNTSDSSIDHG